MGTLIGTGCSECNPDIAAAEYYMSVAPGYCNEDMYLRIAPPRPVPEFDGEPMTGKQVVSLSLSLGLLIRNHLRRMPDGEWRSHLCECESGYVAVELWEGKVALAPSPLAALIG